MGKAAKKKKHASRFDPLARPAAMAVDDDAMEAPPKALSAHQQRHLERKRLQAEALSLKRQCGKVSKADPLAHKREKKALKKSLKATKLESTALRAAKESASAGAAAAAPPDESSSSFTGFDLPMPAQTSGGGWFVP